MSEVNSETIKRMKKVKYSLKAPTKLAHRESGQRYNTSIRSAFMRDRDRILYSKAFRRLAGKTQVYLTGLDDHMRTRLTHTLEVAQIAKTIAKKLDLDLDLTEAIALGHDIGHTPYGHAGERILHEIMTSHDNHPITETPLASVTEEYDDICGFKHNLQSIKIALRLELNYEPFGLDLTNFTLFGIRYHSKMVYSHGVSKLDKLDYYKPYDSACKLPDSSSYAWSFEAFVVRISDDIAQRHHDLEDAMRGNLITSSDVCTTIRHFFGQYLDKSQRGLLRRMLNEDKEFFIADLSKLIVNLLVTKLVSCSIYNLNMLIFENNLNEANFVRFLQNNHPEDISRVISYEYIDTPDGFTEKLKEFEESISKRVLSSYDIQRSDAKGQYVIKKIFQALYNNPRQLPDHCIECFLLDIDAYDSYSNIRSDIKEFGMGYVRRRFTDIYEHEEDESRKIKYSLILMRIICDHISGMTDNYALDTFDKLYN